MTAPDQRLARHIIERIGTSGQPPEYGVQHFSVGLDTYLEVIGSEYLSTFIRDGGSSFKLVVGAYGGGKTHFLYCAREIGWTHDFAVSYVSLKSGGECPFNRLELVYRAVAGGLIPPVTDVDVHIDELRGIENFLRHWYAERLAVYRDQGMSNDAARDSIRGAIEDISAVSVDSISFRTAIVQALFAILNNQEQTFREIIQWLKGESPPTPPLKRLGITQKIDRTTAFSLIRSLGQVMRPLGYSGLLVLLDEAEIVPSLGRVQRDQLLNNLREFIDECGHSTFQGVMVFYAVPDLGFLQGHTQVYTALNQRLSTEFDIFNPTGVRIKLDDAIGDPDLFLREVGDRIVSIYNIAYAQQPIDVSQTRDAIDRLATTAVGQRFMDSGYKRPFVQSLVGELNRLRRQRQSVSASNDR